MSHHPASSTHVDGSQFAATRWSVVIAAGGEAGVQRRRALEELARAYWVPLYAFIRRRGVGAAEAEDLAQGFFAQLLEKNSLARVDRELGKFRSFLLASLKNFMADEWDKGRRQKRGGGVKLVAIDTVDAEERYGESPADDMTPERVFAQRWALAVLEQVMVRLRQAYQERGQGALFEALRGSIAGSAESQSYAEIAGRLSMTEGAVKMAAHRLRGEYRKVLREEIGETVSDPAMIDEEIKFLMDSL